MSVQVQPEIVRTRRREEIRRDCTPLLARRYREKYKKPEPRRTRCRSLTFLILCIPQILDDVRLIEETEDIILLKSEGGPTLINL